MKLIGGYLSPFVRRVAVSLNVLERPYEQMVLSPFADPAALGAHNPIRRVPTLLLDDGEALIDSGAILDHVDEEVGADKALVPASGAARRRVLRLTAIGVGAAEKAVWSFYEYRFHPSEKVHEPWVEQNDSQVVDGLSYLDEHAARLGESVWLAGTPRMSQADITAVVAYGFANRVRPNLNLPERVPALAAYAGRLEATAPFQAAPLPPPT